MKKWYDEYITQDEDGSWNAWDEDKIECLGNYDNKNDAILAVVASRSTNKEAGLVTKNKALD